MFARFYEKYEAADAGSGGWAMRPAKSRDGTLTKKNVTDDEFERLTRNTYKVLFTRVTVGTLIYSTDEETRLFLWFLVYGRPRLVT